MKLQDYLSWGEMIDAARTPADVDYLLELYDTIPLADPDKEGLGEKLMVVRDLLESGPLRG